MLNKYYNQIFKNSKMEEKIKIDKSIKMNPYPNLNTRQQQVRRTTTELIRL